MTPGQDAAKRAEELRVYQEAMKRILGGGCPHDSAQACRPCLVQRGAKHIAKKIVDVAAAEAREEASECMGCGKGPAVLCRFCVKEARREERERCARAICRGCDLGVPFVRPGIHDAPPDWERDVDTRCPAEVFRPPASAPHTKACASETYSWKPCDCKSASAPEGEKTCQ